MCQSSITVLVIEHAVREADLWSVFVEVSARTAKKEEAARGVRLGQDVSIRRERVCPNGNTRPGAGVRTLTGREPFISPERSLGCLDSALL